MLEQNLNGQTLDIVSENVQKLKALFPEIVSEDKIDFEKLQAVLGEYIETDNERYNFTWNGKGKALRLAQTPSTGTLRPCREESKDWDTTQNLYVEGDNLEVLKLLQKTYHNKIKMIYIDPPYNTGNDFVYPDDYKANLENYLKITGQVDEEDRRISTNSEAGGRYHTDWLNMMYPRLRLARNLLNDKGVIFISIDDNEADNLKKLCNEIFGEDNFVAQLVWQKKTGAGARGKGYIGLHEYILCYAKSITVDWDLMAPLAKKTKAMYNKKDEYCDKLGPYATWPLDTTSMDERTNLRFPIFHDGYEIWPKKQWLWSRDRVETAQKENKLIFNHNQKEDSWTVRFKGYLFDETGEVKLGKPTTMFIGPYTQEGTKDFEQFFSRDIFPFPKPVALLKQILAISINQSDDDDIILDFFSGSSTTSQAVLELNSEDGGNRKFIMVQLPELCAEGTGAAKAGYKNICEIGKERIRRVGEKIVNSEELRVKGEQGDQVTLNFALLTLNSNERSSLDVGFKVFKLDSSNLKKWNPDYDNLEASLEGMVSNYVDGRTELDVVYEIMLKYGIDLTFPVEEYNFSGKKVYSIGFGALVICLDSDITTSLAQDIIKLKEELTPETMRVVFKDNGFANDAAKTNVKENLRQAGIDEFVTV